MMMHAAALALLLAAQDGLGRKLEAVLPRPDEERWLRIPWQPNVMKARLDAQRVGKPLLIWVMDGDVLGCT